MYQPPSSFKIIRWDKGEFAEVLFREKDVVSISSASDSSSAYNLSWTNRNGNSRSMALTWNPNEPDGGGTMSGSNVTIYDSSSPGRGTVLMTLPTVTITISSNGSCTGFMNPVLSTRTPTNGVFTAQASPGNDGGDGSYA